MRSHAIYHTMVLAARALTRKTGRALRTFAPAASVPAASASAMASARLVVLVFRSARRCPRACRPPAEVAEERDRLLDEALRRLVAKMTSRSS